MRKTNESSERGDWSKPYVEWRTLLSSLDAPEAARLTANRSSLATVWVARKEERKPRRSRCWIFFRDHHDHSHGRADSSAEPAAEAALLV
jgi:hypothetical protein